MSTKHSIFKGPFSDVKNNMTGQNDLYAYFLIFSVSEKSKKRIAWIKDNDYDYRTELFRATKAQKLYIWDAGRILFLFRNMHICSKLIISELVECGCPNFLSELGKFDRSNFLIIQPFITKIVGHISNFLEGAESSFGSSSGIITINFPDFPIGSLRKRDLPSKVLEK